MSVRESLMRTAHGRALCARVTAAMSQSIPSTLRTVQRLLNTPIGEWDIFEADALAAALGGVPLDHLRPDFLHVYDPEAGTITTFRMVPAAKAITDITQPTEAATAGKA